jgi:hypothetical protein
MIFSYSQISHFLRCPRSYRYRFLDGWQEKEARAGMIFGRCFEKALAAFFLGQDPGASLFEEWSAHRNAGLAFKNGENWDRLYHQGMHLLELFARDSRIRIADPEQNLQIKIERDLPRGDQFVGYLDAIGELDGARSVIDWKTTSSRYVEGPAGILSLDPQLLCYSWLTGISEVAFVVFVRKNHPEIQYLRTSISEQQRKDFSDLVATAIDQIQTAQFPSHSGIRFPQNGCVSCPHLGLCLGDQKLVEANLIRSAGGNDLAWLDELVD